jgi:large subunit ribosomal protein L23
MIVVLKRPIVTEKSMKLAQNGLFTFEVAKEANKPLVASVVRDRFKVDVLSVKIINVKPTKKSQRKVRKTYSIPGYKKALVQLKKGQKIALFETSIAEDVEVTTADEQVVVKEKQDLLRRTKVKVEKGVVSTAPTTQRKVITGK